MGYLLPYHLLYEVPPLEVWSVSLCTSMMAGAVWSSDMMLSPMAGRPYLQTPLDLDEICRSVNAELAELDRMGAPFLIGESHTTCAS